ncbi:hypothetical protein GCM10007199_19510 [Fictibacillus barbaricus]|nr:hypothetical protein GCM10007199_19510 [Fictibacillus barbaricus]
MRKDINLYSWLLVVLGIVVLGRFSFKRYTDYFDLAYIIVLLFIIIYLYRAKKRNRKHPKDLF